MLVYNTRETSTTGTDHSRTRSGPLLRVCGPHRRCFIEPESRFSTQELHHAPDDVHPGAAWTPCAGLVGPGEPSGEGIRPGGAGRGSRAEGRGAATGTGVGPGQGQPGPGRGSRGGPCPPGRGRGPEGDGCLRVAEGARLAQSQAG